MARRHARGPSDAVSESIAAAAAAVVAEFDSLAIPSRGMGTLARRGGEDAAIGGRGEIVPPSVRERMTTSVGAAHTVLSPSSCFVQLHSLCVAATSGPTNPGGTTMTAGSRAAVHV